MTLTSDINICSAEDSTRECPTLHGKQHNLISEQTLGLHTYPPSSSILPNSHSDIGISSAEDSTRERPTLHGQQQKRGLWDIKNKTQRGMKSRHLTMIAIGGIIGTGIFLSAGSSVSMCGPASALLSYCVVGIFVYAMMITLCEMSSMYPVSGAFSTFGTRFVSPALGFTLGWNYWLQWSLAIPSELAAAAAILDFWTVRLQPWQWAIIIIIPTFAFQLIHVRAYGESEYWLAMIKIIMIILFIIVGLIYDWGGIKGHPGPGLLNFHNDKAFVGGISTFAANLGFTLYSFGGVELVAIGAGESSKPYKSVPRATRATFFRIILFYILTILTIGLCINQKDSWSLNSNNNNGNATASPVTLVFRRAGFGLAIHVVNAVLLTAVLSVTNSSYYASSRMLLAMARSGQAPRIFAVVNKRGVPVPALIASLAVSCIIFLTTIWGQSVVFRMLVCTIGLSELITWTSIGVISIRFRQAYKARGRSLSDLPYRQPFYPLLPILVIVLGIAMFIASGYSSVIQQPFKAQNILPFYIIALYIILFCGFMVYERVFTEKKKHFVPISEVDLDSDAVWRPGEGERIRAEDLEESKKRKSSGKSALSEVFDLNFKKV